MGGGESNGPLPSGAEKPADALGASVSLYSLQPQECDHSHLLFRPEPKSCTS